MLFFSLIIVSFILMTYQSNRGLPNPLRLINYPVNIANDAINSICSKIKGSFRKIQLRDEENRRLKLELDNLLMERHKYKEAVLENARLGELLALKEKEKKYVTAARVISRGNDQWTNTLVINKGRHDGVEKDMTVITG
ncbi:MAG: rod shape-determining protein MreC, partial [Thermodesulfovibrionales bacterium]|nr:rod shape-determining protein MreC [Thermodesulfovibrionales bacterium]